MTLAAPAPHTAEDRVVPFPAPAPGPASDASRVSSDVPLNVWSEQIRLLRQHPSLILFNLVNALLVVIVLWPVFPQELLVGWYTLFAIVIPSWFASAGYVAGRAAPLQVLRSPAQLRPV